VATTIQPKRKKRKRSILKRIRQMWRRTEVNRSRKRTLRTQIKRLQRALGAGKVDEAKQLLRPTLSLIDASVHKRVLHRNTAARKKSALARSLAAAG